MMTTEADDFKIILLELKRASSRRRRALRLDDHRRARADDDVEDAQPDDEEFRHRAPLRDRGERGLLRAEQELNQRIVLDAIEQRGKPDRPCENDADGSDGRTLPREPPRHKHAAQADATGVRGDEEEIESEVQPRVDARGCVPRCDNLLRDRQRAREFKRDDAGRRGISSEQRAGDLLGNQQDDGECEKHDERAQLFRDGQPVEGSAGVHAKLSFELLRALPSVGNRRLQKRQARFAGFESDSRPIYRMGDALVGDESKNVIFHSLTQAKADS